MQYVCSWDVQDFGSERAVYGMQCEFLVCGDRGDGGYDLHGVSAKFRVHFRFQCHDGMHVQRRFLGD